jgi:hypothetical protein
MMKATGITVVCIAESTWGTLEPKPGVFDSATPIAYSMPWTRPLSVSSPVIKPEPELLVHGGEIAEALTGDRLSYEDVARNQDAQFLATFINAWERSLPNLVLPTQVAGRRAVFQGAGRRLQRSLAAED